MKNSTYIQFLKTYYGEFIRNLKIKYEYNMDDRPIYNIQTFLGIFKLILAKLIKKSARLEEIEISDFRFSYSEYWNTPEKDEKHTKIALLTVGPLNGLKRADGHCTVQISFFKICGRKSLKAPGKS